ncbi:MAG: alpha/beta fold hydrolase [Nitrososphaerales archaeon]
MNLNPYDNREVWLESGERVTLRTEGSSEQTLLLLHALDAHSGTWRKVIPELAKDYRIIAPTFPRGKKSDQEKINEYSLALSEICTQLEIEKASICGNSLGGWLAMDYAVKNPKKVKKIVLEDSAGYGRDIVREFSKLNIPTLVIWGNDDLTIPIEEGNLLQAQIKSSKLVIIKGGGHISHWNTPEQFLSIVQRFLKS